jgi:serpin B
MSLAGLLNATVDECIDDLMYSLGVTGIDKDVINASAARIMYDLVYYDNLSQINDADSSIKPFILANALFVRNEHTIKSSFAQLYADYYRGNVFSADFRASDTIDTINVWAKERTNGYIPEIVRMLSDFDIAVIANAIYYSNRWAREFDANDTNTGIFHAPKHDVKVDYMLRGGDNLLYYEDDKIQAMPIQFMDGGDLLIVLPKHGDAASVLASMTSDDFAKIHAGLYYATGKLLLPRFTATNMDINLKDALIALGIPLFDDIAKPLTNGLIEKNIPLWLSSAYQSAILEIDEEGATAAAITRITVAGAPLSNPTEPFEMVCDRPFAFILSRGVSGMHEDGGLALFMGVVNQP